jgi:hypothetical protein
MRPCQDVHEYPLSDELVLFSEESGRLYRANATAALIWQGIRAGLKRQDIVTILTEAFNISKEKITLGLDEILSQWRSHGLLDSDPLSFEAYNHSTDDHLPSAEYTRTIPPPNQKSIETYYRILDSRIALRLPGTEEAQLVHPIIVHLKIPKLTKCNLNLEVRRSTDHYVLLRDGSPIDWCDDDRGLAPLVHANILVLAYELSNCLSGIHAAAVVWKDYCILMPALSGSGKSTLTSALVGNGFQYCSDDMVLLTQKPVRVRPATLSIGLKSGSWDLLSKYHPMLALLPTHIRNDGRSIRYLPPPTNELTNNPTTMLTISHIVFPSYQSGNNVTVRPISQAEGLCRIAEAGYDVHGGLSVARVQQLVDWIAKIPCYEFHYSNLGKAVDALKSLLHES